MIPVILSGGSGSRLWPLSRALRPKQFLELTGEHTLFQLTLQRLTGLVDHLAPIVVSNDDHRFLVADQCLQMGVKPRALLLEPVARNTAPAIAVAALAARGGGGSVAQGAAESDPVLLVLPSDHVFANVAAFEAAVRIGEKAAQAGAMVTFGIVPTAPETGYGYVKATSKTGSSATTAASGALPVEAFVEKPDLATAQNYLADGHYFWNSGMFMFKASVFLSELGRHNPTMLTACQKAYTSAKRDLDFIRLDKEAFASSPSDSIDYAVMEKTDKAVVVPLDAGWSDVGAWSAVWQVQPQDKSGNGVRGDVLLHESNGCYVHADHRLVSLVGVTDLVVVETSDAVLVAHKDKAQDVKKVVDALKAKGRTEADLHREVFRPWGAYDSIDNGERYQVKRITVKPGARLSIQMHHHRAEHWIVVKGTAKVTIGEQEQLISENQSVYIPIGEKHCLENPGKVALELIEVQSGSYLGEDDIVRFDDKYGRA
jgi:mannose-1-phosphate guanylyltransferase/mannose-6-phosphate isomerase